MKKLLVIQEHTANKAGLHWDLRMEYDSPDISTYLDKRPVETSEPRTVTEKVLKSWVVKKCKMPSNGEKLLAIPTEEHPWDYRNFEGEISEGYGQGLVRLIFSDYVEVLEYTENKISFIYLGFKYNLIKVSFGWLLMKGE